MSLTKEQRIAVEEVAKQHKDIFMPYKQADELIALVMAKGKDAREEVMRWLINYAAESSKSGQKLREDMLKIAQSND